MQRRKKQKYSRTRTRNHHLFHFLFFLFHWSISARISTCSRSVGSVARSVQSLDELRNQLRSLMLRRRETTNSFGFYYGIPRTVLEPVDTNQKISDSCTAVNQTENDDGIPLAKRRYLDGYESIGRDVEKWAENILRDSAKACSRVGVQDKNDWNEVFCSKAFRSMFNNGDDNSVPVTRQWVKWMKDSREEHADPNDKQKHPCMKLVATIDAPFPIVCRYLSEKNRFREYNSLLVDQEDVEVLTPHSKICWSQSKKLCKSNSLWPSIRPFASC